MISEKEYELLEKISRGNVYFQDLTSDELHIAECLAKKGLIKADGLHIIPDSGEVLNDGTKDNAKKRCRNRYPYGNLFLLSMSSFFVVRVLFSLFKTFGLSCLLLALLLVGLCFAFVFLFKRCATFDSESD